MIVLKDPDLLTDLHLLILPLQSVNPLIRSLDESALPLLNEELRNCKPQHQGACGKKGCHQVPSSLRCTTCLSQSIVNLLQLGVFLSEE